MGSDGARSEVGSSDARSELSHRDARARGGHLVVLDALRGVAVTAVFAQHLGDRYLPVVVAGLERALPAPLAGWARATVEHAFWGVDLFFVLSGFSLAYAWLHARDAAPSRAPRAFFARRAARIYPAFLVALAVVVARRPSLVAAPHFFAAVAAHLALLQGYVAPGGVVFIGAAWSLTTEAHFYLVFPWLARRVLGGDARRRWLTVAATCAFAWGTRAALHELTLHPGVRTALLESTQRHWATSRLDQLVLGIAAAALHHAASHDARWRERAARLGAPMLLAAACALVAGFGLEGPRYLAPHGWWPYTPLSLATAALVLGAALCEPRGRPAPPLRLVASLGVVSYGVFLYHQLALDEVAARLGVAPTARSLAEVGVASFALSVALGAASYRLVERPALAWQSARARAGQ